MSSSGFPSGSAASLVRSPGPVTAPAARTASDAGGRLTAWPGRGLPNLGSSRREWAARLAPGRRSSEVPGLLATLYALCGGAHRVTARAAMAAARGLVGDTMPGEIDELHLDTAREHVRRLWLDWPQVMTHAGRDRDEPGPGQALRSCPVLQSAAADAAGSYRSEAMRDWLVEHAFGLPLHEWLDGWSADPAAWLSHWTASRATWPARLLDCCRRDAQQLGTAPAPLLAHAQPAELLRIARQLREDPGYALAPLWRGHCAETGPWTRLLDPLARTAAMAGTPAATPTRSAPAARAPGSAWIRFGSRLADLAHIALATPGRPWLQQGAVAIAPGESIAYSEMARGLLLHWVQLDANDLAAGAPDPRVARCRVVAPTEWNFHPHGLVAQALACLSPSVRGERVRLLAAAFDPCVELDVARVAPESSDRGDTQTPEAVGHA